MKKKLFFFMIVEIFVIFFTNLICNWSLFFLPYLLKKEKYYKESDLFNYMLLNYMSFFYGTLVGTFVWKFVSKYFSSKVLIFLSLLISAVVNVFEFQYQQFTYFCIFRFISGFAVNFEKLGKSYVHEFTKKELRYTYFIVENVAYSTTNLLAPFIGNFIYQNVNQKTTQISLILSFSILFSALLFILGASIQKHRKKQIKLSESEMLL